MPTAGEKDLDEIFALGFYKNMTHPAGQIGVKLSSLCQK